MNRVRSILCGLAILLLGSNGAWAWNDLGHITIAQIAFRQLSADERAAVVKILRNHPHIDTYFQKPAGLAISDDEWLFLRAATWCDSVRPPRDFDRTQIKSHPIYKFHHGPWHYINYPFQVGQPATDQLPTPLTPSEDEKTDAIQQLNQTRGILNGTITEDPAQADGLTPEQNKAVRLCWLFHLLGDLHQPLHTTALVDAQLFPGPNHGDAGGNFCLIRTSNTARPLNLHAYWDGLLGPASGWRDGNNAERLTQDVERCRMQADLLTHAALAADRLPELQQHPDFVDWALEGYLLAVSVAYDGGNLKFAARKDMDEPQIPADQIPVLPPVLQEKARATANKRVALAGYRLGSQLRTIVAASSR